MRDYLARIGAFLAVLAIAFLLGKTSMDLPKLESKYLNMTEREHWDQTARPYSSWATECRKKGGYWSVGFSTAYCTVGIDYQAIKDRVGYVPPEVNPAYYRLDMVSIVGVSLAIVFGLTGGMVSFASIFDPDYGFDAAKLFRRRTRLQVASR